MDVSPGDVRANRRLMARSAATLYAAAGLGGLLDRLAPGGPAFSLVPSVAALALAGLLVVAGSRMPERLMLALGPIGVAFVAYAFAESPNAGDTTVLFVLPVAWTARFFGGRGAAFIVVCVGAAYGAALLALPPASDFLDRWIDVMVAVCAVAAVVAGLVRHNAALLRRVAGEARTDALTGALNRRGFDERGAVELARTRREGSPIALALFDVDRFKAVNDEYGHDVGDRVLVHVALALAGQCREIDVVARLGGDEFVALLPGAGGADAAAFTRRVRAALESLDAAGLPAVGISVGIATATTEGDMEALLAEADAALYAAKRAGRGRTRILSEGAPVEGDAREQLLTG